MSITYSSLTTITFLFLFQLVFNEMFIKQDEIFDYKALWHVFRVWWDPKRMKQYHQPPKKHTINFRQLMVMGGSFCGQEALCFDFFVIL